MTTGSRTMNGRYTIMGANGGGGFSSLTIGRYFGRSWTGGNASPATIKKVRKGPQSLAAKQLVLTPNPYRVDWDEETRGSVRITPNLEQSFSQPMDTTIVGFTTPFPDLDPRQIYKLIAKLQRKIYGSDFHPAAALAEGFQAIDMIYNAAVRIGASIEAVKRRDWRALKRALPWLHPDTMKGVTKTGKSTSQIVLEVQYGWRPLMSDAHDAGTWLAAAMDQTNRSNDNYAVTRRWQTETVARPLGYGDPYLSFATEHTFWQARYQVLTQSIQASYLPTMWSFAEAVWEKTPYSFIGDWFVPIGAYLQSMNTLTGIVGTFILSVKAEKIGEGIQLNNARITSAIPQLGDNRQVTGYMYREVSQSPIVPKPLSLARPGEALSKERTVNAIALIGSRAWSSLLAELYQHPPTSGRLRP